MNADFLSVVGAERPVGWLQYDDGSWAAVFEDATVSKPFSAALLDLIRTGVIDAEPSLESLQKRGRKDMYTMIGTEAGPGPDGNNHDMWNQGPREDRADDVIHP
ncbi:hypothetical protein ACQP0C_30155 [Nocardia sp. CA-129566]|uniref:hypothetical protein n=1 Tax=Nocardia sp. CA-129566 TaxID=3239976 RepID=UPI003D974F63